MINVIKEAPLIKYNANSRGTNTKDCSIRSISLALDQSYQETSKGLKSQCTRPDDSYKTITNITSYVKSVKPGVELINTEGNVMLEDFADEHTVGTYLVFVGKSRTQTYSKHAVCLIDGTIYDTWDCRKWYVKEYINIKKRSSDRNLESVFADKETVKEIATFVQSESRKLLDKYINKYDIQNIYDVDKYEYISVGTSGVVQYQNYINDKRLNENYKIKIKFSVPLGLSYDDVLKYVDKQLDKKLYSRFYNINKDIQDQLEGLQGYEDEGSSSFKSTYYLNGNEKRFYNGLPGWVKPLLINIEVPNPFYGVGYSNDYMIRFKPLHQDSNRNTVVISGLTSNDIKGKLDIYKNGYDANGYSHLDDLDKFSRPDDDYDAYEYGFDY